MPEAAVRCCDRRDRCCDRRDPEHKARWQRLLAHVHLEEIAPLVESADTIAATSLRRAGEDFVSAAQLMRVAAAELAREKLDEALRLEELATARAVEALDAVDEYLVQTGVAAVIDRHRFVIASELEVEDLPDGDLEALGRCGVVDPWAEAALSVLRLRRSSEHPPVVETLTYEQAVHDAREKIDQGWTRDGVEAAKGGTGGGGGEPNGGGTQGDGGETEGKQQRRGMRRWFKGVGAIVKGGALIAIDGGLLIAGAPITVADPSASAAVLGSMAMGFGDVTSGAGDLRGE